MTALDITQDQSLTRPLALQDSLDDITDGGALDLSNTTVLDIGNPEDPDAP